MANLITMAGKGKRFSDAGYLLPKPLIDINGEPMIYRVIDSLPESDKWIFVVREEHIKEHHIDAVIKRKIPDAIIEVDRDLLGGASIFCVEKYFEKNEEVLIASCDNAFVFDAEKFEELKKEGNACILWTFTNDKRISRYPHSWGYTVLENDGKTIKNMSVKVPISNRPENDHAVTATFYVKSASLLYEAIRLMIEKSIKTNNEFYLDNLPIAFNLLGRKSVIFDVELYVGFGTPEELHEFESLLHRHEFSSIEKAGLDSECVRVWEKYFCDIHGHKK